MKSVAAVTVACMLASASAFTAPTMATRAVGNPFARNKAKTEAVAVSILQHLFVLQRSFFVICMSFVKSCFVRIDTMGSLLARGCVLKDLIECMGLEHVERKLDDSWQAMDGLMIRCLH